MATEWEYDGKFYITEDLGTCPVTATIEEYRDDYGYPAKDVTINTVMFEGVNVLTSLDDKTVWQLSEAVLRAIEDDQ